MANTIELFKSFVYGMADYIARHNANYSLIESSLNQVLGQLTGQSGSLSVPWGLQEIFDRREVDPANGNVSVNQTGFTAGRIPLYLVVTDASSITTITDKRTWAVYGAGGGGGGGHTQNTDLGTTGNTFTLNLDEAAEPSQDCKLEVERGTSPNVAVRWNEATDKWEYTEDGSNWKGFGEVNLDLGVQELTRYVPKENPDLVLEELNRGSSSDYEDLDLPSYLDAPQGVQAVALRVIFWDETPGNEVNVRFKKKGSAAVPPLAYTVWSGLNDPGTIILPTDDDLVVQFLVSASGSDSAGLRVFLLGCFEKVTGVGTQDKTFTRDGLEVPAGSAVQLNLTGCCNRGLVHYLKVEETGGLITGTYSLEIHGKDTFDALLYKAEGMTPSPPFEDWLPFWVQDRDGSRELHLKIRNNDLDHQGTFKITLNLEMFD
jgi:hypothetical protein